MPTLNNNESFSVRRHWRAGRMCVPQNVWAIDLECLIPFQYGRWYYPWRNKSAGFLVGQSDYEFFAKLVRFISWVVHVDSRVILPLGDRGFGHEVRGGRNPA